MDYTKDPAWITIEETAQYLRCSLRHLRETVSRREIPYTKFGGKILFNRNRVDEWMIENEETPVSHPKEEKDTNKQIDTTIISDCDRQKVNALIQELIDYNERFVSVLGNNLLMDLSNNKYRQLSDKIYAQLSRWCHPKRNSEREIWAKEKASEISVLLYGKVIERIKHPSYIG
jgi:excisionase family DNA binding protein